MTVSNRTLPVSYDQVQFKPKSLRLPTIVSRGRDGGSLDKDIQKAQLLTVDHSARGSMKTAASCVSVCESQEYQIHRQVERTLRRRHSHVLPPLLHEGRIYIVNTSALSAPRGGGSPTSETLRSASRLGVMLPLLRAVGSDRIGEISLKAFPQAGVGSSRGKEGREVFPVSRPLRAAPLHRRPQQRLLQRQA